MKRTLCLMLLLVLLLAVPVLAASDQSTVQAPQLWKTNIGAHNVKGALWSEESYHSSVKVVDLDGDGVKEILGASYTLFCVNGKTGEMKWKAPSGHDSSTPDAQYEGRIWGDVQVADVDADGSLEVVVGDEMGTLAVYDKNGRFKPGWPRKLSNVPLEIMSVRLSDLDLDGTMEIIAAVGEPGKTVPEENVWVYEHDGALRPGWPQYRKGTTDAGLPESFSYGCYSDCLAVDDMNGDGYPEIYVPADVPHICAYDGNGKPLLSAYRENGVQVPWGRVAAWMDVDFEKTVENGGWGYSADGFTGNKWLLHALPASHRYTGNFTYCEPVIDDLDGDGKKELAVVARVYDRADGFPLANGNPETDSTSLYQSLFIFNADRTRFVSGTGDDWSTTPCSGALLSEWHEDLTPCSGQIVSVDLDGDGRKELLYPTADGKLNCTWLDKTQKYSWPINVYDGKTMEYATAPAVKDLDFDGRPELIFGTYTEIHGKKKGSLYIANYKGEVIHRADLPDASEKGMASPNACINAPVVEDVDGDGVYEAVFMGYQSSMTIYKLPAVKASALTNALPVPTGGKVSYGKDTTAYKAETNVQGSQPYMTWLYNNYQPDQYVLYPNNKMLARTHGTRYVLLDAATGKPVTREYLSWVRLTPTRVVTIHKGSDTGWFPKYGLLDAATGKELIPPTRGSCTWGGVSLEQYAQDVTMVDLCTSDTASQNKRLVMDGLTIDVETGGTSNSPTKVFYDLDRGLIPITQNGKKGYYSPSGAVLVPAEYDELTVCGSSDQYFLARKNGKYGMFDRTGQVVFPFLFDKMWCVSGSGDVYARHGSYIGLCREEDYVAWGKCAGQKVTMGPAVGHETVPPRENKVLFNGSPVTLNAYLFQENAYGGGGNYVKLREVALLLSGSPAQFEVTWDQATGTIALTTGQPYTVVGGETTLSGGGQAQGYRYNPSTITLNGKPISLRAYTINSNNYFRLRDLGEALNFAVDWDGSNVILKTN